MADKQAEYANAAALYKQALDEGANPDEARSAYDAAVKAIAMRPDAPAQAVAAPQRPQAQPQSAFKEAALGGGQRTSMAALSGTDASAAHPVASGMTQEFTQGATMGGADELMGVFGGDERQKAMRNERAAFNEQHPALAMGANVAGNVVASLPFAKAAQGAGMAAKAARLLTGAVGQGAITGALESDGEGDSRLGGAVAGGVVGGAVGRLGGALAGKAAQTLARRLGGGTGANAAERRAVSIVTDRLGDSQVTPELLPTVAGSNRGVDARMVDVMGDPGERMLRSLSTTGGKGGEKAKNFVAQRLRSYQDRLSGAIGREVAPANIPRTVEGFIKQRKAVSDPLYDAFRSEAPLASDKLDDLFELPQFKKALAIAEDLRKGKPETPQFVGTGKIGQDGKEILQRAYTPEFLDNVKKALDDMIYTGKKTEGGVGPAQLKALKDKRADLLEVLDKAYPDSYATARGAWSGETATKEAFEDGMEVFKKRLNPDAIADLTNGLTPSDREVFMQGASSELVRQIEEGGIKPGTTEHSAFLKRVTNTFGDKANDILSSLRDEVAAQRTGARVMGKSDTAERLTEIMDAITPERENIWQVAGFNPGRAVAQLGGKFLRDRSSTAFFSPARSALADVLLSPQSDAKVLQRIAQEAKSQHIGKATSRAVKGPLAMQTARGFLMNREQR